MYARNLKSTLDLLPLTCLTLVTLNKNATSSLRKRAGSGEKRNLLHTLGSDPAGACNWVAVKEPNLTDHITGIVDNGFFCGGNFI